MESTSMESLASFEQKMALLQKGQTLQKKLSLEKRSEILLKLSALFFTHQDELAELITIEVGKTVRESKKELVRAHNTLKLCAHYAMDTMMSGEKELSHNGDYKYGLIERSPLGVVLAITPFNFPVNLFLHKLGPAFAAGNVVLYKPHPLNVNLAQRMLALCYEAGLDEHFLQMINPDLDFFNKMIIPDERIHCINFTGGVVAAKSIAKNAGIKKLIFELGGNDPLIVYADGDVDKAVASVINGRFGISGQRCIAPKRIFVQETIMESFKSKLVQETQKLVIGDPLSMQTDFGPLVSTEAAILIENRVNEAIKAGGNVLCGGQRIDKMYLPTVIENMPLDCDLIREETFGPIAPLITFADNIDLLKKIQMAKQGLQAGVFTLQLDNVKWLFKNLELGALFWNEGPGMRIEHFPFGGVNLSGVGREGPQYAMQEMTYLKTLIF